MKEETEAELGPIELEFQSWPGFAAARKADEILTEHPEILESLESHQPELRLRIFATLDLVETFRGSPAAAVTTPRFQDVTISLQHLAERLRDASENPANAHQQASAILEHCSSVLWTLRPHVLPEAAAESESILASARKQAVAAVHGVKVSAGKARKEVERGAADTLGQLEKTKEALETAMREAIQVMNQEAADARARMEGSLNTAATNALAELERLRTTGETIATTLDDTYRETVSQLEQSIAETGQHCDRLVSQLNETYDHWGDAVQSWSAESAAAANHVRTELEQTQAWADGIRGDIQIAALASGFSTKETHHRTRAKWALWVAGALGAIAFAAAALAFSIWYRIDPTASGSEIARDVALRSVVSAIPLTAAAFAARVYRTHSHLATVYGERAAASTAFEGFASRARDEAIADQLLVALAQLVFAGRDTGHHTDEQIVPTSALSSIASTLVTKRK